MHTGKLQWNPQTFPCWFSLQFHEPACFVDLGLKLPWLLHVSDGDIWWHRICWLNRLKPGHCPPKMPVPWLWQTSKLGNCRHKNHDHREPNNLRDSRWMQVVDDYVSHLWRSKVHMSAIVTLTYRISLTAAIRSVSGFWILKNFMGILQLG